MASPTYDNNNFFNTGFESDATLTTSASGESSIKVHFFNEYEVSQIFSVEFGGSNPRAYAKTSDIADAVDGDTIAIDGQNGGSDFTIIEIEQDGTGGSWLVLKYD